MDAEAEERARQRGYESDMERDRQVGRLDLEMCFGLWYPMLAEQLLPLLVRALCLKSALHGWVWCV